MKRLLSSLLIFSALLSLSSADSVNEIASDKYVYICNNNTAGKYHLSSSCRGLNACTHGIVKVTLKEAGEMGKKDLCGWED